MKARPSRWNLSPFGQPSYCTTSSHSPFLSMRKMRPNGISTHQRLPCRSNDGPSRKLSTAAPWRFGSDHFVRCFLRNLGGRALKRRTSIFLIGWKGFSMECGEGYGCSPFIRKPPRRSRTMKLLAGLLLALVTAAALAQTNVRVRGTITALSGDTLNVKTREGREVQ